MTEKMKKLSMDLRDDTLRDLLRDTYNDDPALIPDPARSERIMRRVLAGKQSPALVRGWWPRLAWVGGALAMGGLAVAMFIATHTVAPKTERLVKRPTVSNPAPDTTAPQELAPIVAPPAPEVVEVADNVIPSARKSRSNRKTENALPTRVQDTNIQNDVNHEVIAASVYAAEDATISANGLSELASACIAVGDTEGALRAMEMKQAQDADPDTDLAIAHLLTDNAAAMML